MKKCVFAGTFDPLTLGHEDTVRAAKAVFDTVVVAVLQNPQKTPFFTLEERMEILNSVYGSDERVQTVAFSGAVVDLLQRENTPFYVRGIRNTVDFEYENANFYASRRLDGEMIALYFPSEQEHLHISSTLVRNSLVFGKPISECVSRAAEERIIQILQRRKQNV